MGIPAFDPLTLGTVRLIHDQTRPRRPTNLIHKTILLRHQKVLHVQFPTPTIMFFLIYKGFIVHYTDAYASLKKRQYSHLYKHLVPPLCAYFITILLLYEEPRSSGKQLHEYSFDHRSIH